ncbi:MAG: ABC transporter ATP-binding protein [Planctomycetaceae bacterium]|nr:ABC transporter ATP-binding protein [Planctomycetaceae bacterium]
MSCKRLDIQGLTLDLHSPRPRHLVDGLSLSLEAGKALALVGESGAGKSMTALAVMGLLPPSIHQTGGEIFVNETGLSSLTDEGRRRLRNRTVAMILQNPMSAFDPIVTVLGHFKETLCSHIPGMDRAAVRQRAAAALVEVGFSDPEALLGVYPFQMSGGMLQRVMIGLALCTDPTFIIADEATTDLDVVLQKNILHLLRDRCRERHLGLLVITHDLGIAAWLADDIAVMRHGRVVESGSTASVFSGPREDYTRELLEAHRDLHGNRFGCLMAAIGTEATA